MYSDFIKELYAEKAESDYILIWTPNKKSFFTKEISKAVEYVESVIEGHNVFFGVGTSPQDFGIHNRCTKDKISGIPGLYLDIDIKNPLHKKENLPESIDEAIALATFDGLLPSLIVNSGHGIHVYYLFDDFWHFSCDEERQKAQDLNILLHETVKARAESNGWIIDSVFDFARVLRLPGTYNMKDPNDIRMCYIEEDNECTYSISHIDDALKKLSKQFIPEKPKQSIEKSATFYTDIKELSDALFLDASNEPDQAKLDDLKVIFSDDFNKDWENIKNQFTSDTSPSAYDMKLAIKAAQMGWPDQEICNLMIAHRNYQGHDLKIKNKQYYARSILSARSYAKKMAEKQAAKTNAELADPPEQEDQEDKITSNFVDEKETLYASINARLGYGDLKIIEIIKYIEDPEPIYYMTIEIIHKVTGFPTRRNATLGNSSALIEQRIFRKKLVDLGSRILKPLTRDEWLSLSNCLVEAAYERDIAPDSTDIGQINVWLCEYLRNKQPITPEEAFDTKDPFVLNGVWYIFRDKFHKWAKYTMGSMDTIKTFSLNLKRFGANPDDVYIADPTNPNKKIHVSVWKLPPGFIGKQ